MRVQCVLYSEDKSYSVIVHSIKCSLKIYLEYPRIPDGTCCLAAMTRHDGTIWPTLGTINLILPHWLVQCPHQSIRHSLVEWGSSLSYIYSTSYIRDLINVLPINWYLWCEHIILLPGGDIPWHCETGDHCECYHGTTHPHKPGHCLAADTMVWPLGTEWPQITRIPSLLRAPRSCNMHTYTRSYHCVGVCTVYWVVVCKNQERVAPDYE